MIGVQEKARTDLPVFAPPLSLPLSLAWQLARASARRPFLTMVTREQVRLQAGFRCVAARGGRGDWQTMTCVVIAKWTKREEEKN